MFKSLRHWFFGLGPKYGVDPLIFGAIYVGAIPFFTLSPGWLIRNLSRRKSIVLPLLCASLCFISAYLYLLVAGKNIPMWVYLFIGAVVVFGAVPAVRKVRKSVAAIARDGTAPRPL